MKVILLDYVYKHGVAGEVIDVADGFARNYLIPKRLAVKATPGELKRASKLRDQAAAKRAALENRMNELAAEIDGVELIFGRRAASTGKLFGSVTTQEIADALLDKTGVDINRRRISQQSVREIGTHDVAVRLGSENSPVLKITVVREEEMMEFLAKRAAQEAGELEGEEAAEAVQEIVQELAEEVNVTSSDMAQTLEDAASSAVYAAENIVEEPVAETTDEGVEMVEAEAVETPADEDDDTQS